MSEREIAELMKKKKTFTSTVGHIAAACELIMKFMKEDDIPQLLRLWLSSLMKD